MSIRSISSSLLISRNTVKRYIRIYEYMGIELERLLKMDEQHLHELFNTDPDNESSGSAEYKYLEERIPEYIKFVDVAKKYPVKAVHSSYGILSLVEHFGQDKVVLSCQIEMELGMFGYNELESILVNRSHGNS